MLKWNLLCIQFVAYLFLHISYINYCDVIMGEMASQITSLTNVYPTVYSSSDQIKHQSSTSLAFVRGIHWWPVNSPRKWLVTRKMLSLEDVIMILPFILGSFDTLNIFNSPQSSSFHMQLVIKVSFEPFCTSICTVVRGGIQIHPGHRGDGLYCVTGIKVVVLISGL